MSFFLGSHISHCHCSCPRNGYVKSVSHDACSTIHSGGILLATYPTSANCRPITGLCHVRHPLPSMMILIEFFQNYCTTVSMIIIAYQAYTPTGPLINTPWESWFSTRFTHLRRIFKTIDWACAGV